VFIKYHFREYLVKAVKDFAKNLHLPFCIKPFIMSAKWKRNGQYDVIQNKCYSVASRSATSEDFNVSIGFAVCFLKCFNLNLFLLHRLLGTLEKIKHTYSGKNTVLIFLISYTVWLSRI